MSTLTERDILIATTVTMPMDSGYFMSAKSITRQNQATDVVVSPTWLGRARQRLKELSLLQMNWDSYGAVPIDPRIGRIAKDLVEWFAVDDMPPPDVFATNDGGIQIEWHVRRVNIEIEISPEGTTIYFHDLNSGEPWSRPASSADLQAVRRRLLALA